MKKLLLILSIIFTITNIKAEVFKAGSYIINMGVTPQTYTNGLAPYGLIYDLVIGEEAPVYWIIRPGKQLFGTDFTYNGVAYKAGSIVIPKIFVTPAVEALIANAKATGIIIDGPTPTDFEAPVYNYISSFPNAILDSKNASLTQALFYNHTSIPSTYYSTGTPDDIGTCSDVYALPHADPQDWTPSQISKYIAYTNSKSKSFLWQGCHSVGAVEGHNANGVPPVPTTPIPTTPALTLDITADVTIQVDDKFEIIDDFPVITITTHVIIWAKELTLGKNVKINITGAGYLEVHTSKGENFSGGASITGNYTHAKDGGKSGNGNDGDIGKISTTLTINSNKQYKTFQLEDNTGGGGNTNGGYLNLFMLTTNGQIAWKKDIDYTFDNQNSPAFEYEANAGDHPIMQIAGKMDDGTNNAFDGGSQRIYIPRPDSDWRSTTTVAIWDPTNVNNSLNGGNPKKAALIAFGRTYGDPQNGILVQHASHEAAHSNVESHNVNSGRIYGNLLLQASIEKRPIVTISAPNQLYFPNDYNMTATVARGAAPYDFKWSISCDGNSSVGTFTPQIQLDVNDSKVVFSPANITLGNCILRVNVTDACGRKNFDTKILGITGYHPPLGHYNVTHTNERFTSSGGKDPLDTAHVNNSLYTQISGKPFNVSIAALDIDKETPIAKTSNVILELIDTSGVTELEPSSCAKAGVFQDVTGNIQTDANGAQFNNTAYATATNIQYPNAIKEVGFRVSYFELPLAGANDSYSYGIPLSMSKADLDAQFPDCSTVCTNNPQASWDCYKCIAKSALIGGYGKAVCARDNFAIRPASFSLGINGTSPLIGGKTYPFDIQALSNTGAVDILYTEPNIGTASIFKIGSTGYIDSNLTLPSGCGIDPTTTTSAWAGNSVQFISGIGADTDNDPATGLTYVYNNIGDVRITARETTWSAIDIDKTPLTPGLPIYDDCVKNSGSNTANAEGKIGCMVLGETVATFTPLSFINTFAVKNFKDGTFSYLSSETRKMYGEIDFTTRAVLQDNATTATNYTSGCYAKDINYTITFTEPTAPAVTLGWSDLATRLDINTTGSSSTTVLAPSNSSGTDLTSQESTFTTGISTQNLRFNFDRKRNTPENPFKIKNTDFDITVTDGITNGNDFNRTTESNASFFYARARATKDFYDDIPTNTIRTPISVLVHCNLWLACAGLGVDTINGQTNDSNWWISTAHNESNGDGNITLTESNAFASVTTDVTVLTNGTDNTTTVTKTGGAVPLSVDILLDTTSTTATNSWLIYNLEHEFDDPTPFYKVRFIGTSGWSGVGETGHVLENNASSVKTKRLNW